MNQSKLNIWIKENNLDNQWLQNNGRFPKYQIEKLLNDPIYKPDGTTMRIILSIVKRNKPTAKLSDFWEV
ncbi:hypothetical protein [Metabacillus sp. SLBN-84]